MRKASLFFVFLIILLFVLLVTRFYATASIGTDSNCCVIDTITGSCTHSDIEPCLTPTGSMGYCFTYPATGTCLCLLPEDIPTCGDGMIGLGEECEPPGSYGPANGCSDTLFICTDMCTCMNTGT